MLPQAPQFIALVWVSTHVPSHSAWPVGHVQTPATQLEPPAQACPQPPQLPLSVCVFTQEPLQLVGVVPPQATVQAPFWQTWPLRH